MVVDEKTYKDSIYKIASEDSVFKKTFRGIDKEFLHEGITCHNLYMNYLLNGFSNSMKSIVKML